MKISSVESARAGQVAPVGSSANVAPVAPISGAGSASGPAATVELSSTVQARAAARTEAATYLPAVNAVPDREDKVNELKARIAAGTYQVSGQDIAGQMLRRAQADKIQ